MEIIEGDILEIENLLEIENYVAILKLGGFDTQNYMLNTGHNLTQEDIDLSVKWFQNINLVN